MGEMRNITLLQLPFPSLGYFPVPEYFGAMQNWCRKNVDPTMNIPDQGIWEAPPWITHVQAHLLAIAQESAVDFRISVLDLSDEAYSSEDVVASLEEIDPPNAVFVSPLTQNSILTKKVCEYLTRRGVHVGIGGHATYHFRNSETVSIFSGRIEHDPQRFASWVGELLGENGLVYRNYPKGFSQNLSLAWAVKYIGRNIYNRFYTHHGCPFLCTFCADRNTKPVTVDKSVLYAELSTIEENFTNQRTLYIGDSTLGISKSGIANLEALIQSGALAVPKQFIAQTNLALISNPFLSRVKSMGVRMLEVGVETASFDSARNLQKYRKNGLDLHDKISLVLDSGMSLAMNVIFGLPEETHDQYENTLSFIDEWCGRVWFNIYGLVPYHNTPIYRALARDHRIIHRDYDRWCEGAPLVFDPFNITGEEVAGYLEAGLRMVTEASRHRDHTIFPAGNSDNATLWKTF